MRKSFCAVIAMLGTALAVTGCETSNQDYSSSGKVIDARAQTPSAPRTAAAVQVYGADGLQARSTQPEYASRVQTQTSAQPQAIEVYNPTAENQPYAEGVNDPAPIVYNPVQKQTAAPADGTVQPYAAGSSADTYTVVKGDTLYSIAFRYGLDYKTVAQNNGIEPPYNIAVGQVIRLNLGTAASSPSYTVKRGDTLYSIAKANGQSVDFLAGVNNLSEPYTLSVGQVIKLARTEVKGQSSTTVIPVAGQTQKETDNRALKNTQAAQQTAAAASSSQSKETAAADPVVVAGKTRTVSGVTWMWPTLGKVIEQFSLAEQGNKGVDISGKQGQAVVSAADGQVVYAGNALRGYGNLIIINHSNEFLSAYAHNDALLVSEGQKVVRGQQVARMGSTDAKSTRLHFEIRYRGQSVNPLSYLPK